MQYTKKIKIISNNLQALRNYRRKKVVLDNLPSYIWLEPTNHCNLKCVMCPNGAGKVSIEKGYMRYGLFCKIIDQIADFASSITLAVGGESLLHPRFFDMIRYCKKKGIKVLINTNATLLDTSTSKDLLNTGVDYISFAFDGFNKRSYEKARKGAVFEKTLDNIIQFLMLKKRMGKLSTYCILSILKLELDTHTDDEKRNLIHKLNGLIDEVRLREVSSWGRTFKSEQSFMHRKHESVFPPCSRLWSTACITWNGNVVPCIYNANHEYILGNLKEKNFTQIWNDNQMVRLRTSMLDGSYLDLSPLCENCIVLGTPPILSIPSGLRLTLADTAVNFFGYQTEKKLLGFANLMRKRQFTSITVE